MAPHDAAAVYFTEYLSVLFQLTILDELYGECNRIARACANSGYVPGTLLPNHRVPGNEATGKGHVT